MTLHHLSSIAPTPVGYLRDGRPVWPIAGGSDPAPTDPPADPPTDPPADPPKGDPPADPPKGEPSPLEQQAQEAIDQLKQAGQEVPKALEQAVKEFRDARREAANYRAQGKEQAQQQAEAMKQLAKAFGIDVADDEPPDPAELQKQIESSQGDAKQARVELAAYKLAGKHDANPDALLDSRTFMDRVAKLDPSSDSFDADLESAIKASVEANDALKATPGGGQSRGPAQGPRSTPDARPKSMADAVTARYQR